MDWIELPIPACLASGPVPNIIHYLKLDDKWSVYAVEVACAEVDGVVILPPHVPAPGSTKWLIVSEGKELASGTLKGIDHAKKIAMTTLHALMDLPVPECESEGYPELSMDIDGRGAVN